MFLNMHALLLVLGILLTIAGLAAAAMATSDPLQTRRGLIVISALLVSLGAVTILFAIAGMVERFA